MAEYRDVEPLRKQIVEFKTAVKQFEKSSSFLMAYISGIDAVMEAIDKLPITDVQEVRHGCWKKRMSTSSSVKCSKCGNSYEYATAYCPHCGARMDGEEE